MTIDEGLQSDKFEEMLKMYFQSLRVSGGKDESGNVEVLLPKQKTLEATMSNLKCAIMTKTGNKTNILDLQQFPELQRLIKGFSKDIKNNGRGETQHREPMVYNEFSQKFW